MQATAAFATALVNSCKNLEGVKSAADQDFFRVHNFDLINLSYIKSYNKGKGGSVILTYGTELEVSTRRKDEFLKKMAGL